ncbi:MAG: hypothetical protein WA183_11685 [Chthoniobacterales bacterium]
MAERDINQEALDQVQKITESGPDNGEDLLESEDLKRQLREAKERLRAEATRPKDGQEDWKS